MTGHFLTEFRGLPNPMITKSFKNIEIIGASNGCLVLAHTLSDKELDNKLTFPILRTSGRRTSRFFRVSAISGHLSSEFF
jgi:hypothetical protein